MDWVIGVAVACLILVALIVAWAYSQTSTVRIGDLSEVDAVLDRFFNEYACPSAVYFDFRRSVGLLSVFGASTFQLRQEPGAVGTIFKVEFDCFAHNGEEEEAVASGWRGLGFDVNKPHRDGQRGRIWVELESRSAARRAVGGMIDALQHDGSGCDIRVRMAGAGRQRTARSAGTNPASSKR